MLTGLSAGAILAAAGWVAFASGGPVLVLNEREFPIDLGHQPEAQISEAVLIRSRQLLAEDAYLSVEGEVFASTFFDLGFRVDERAAAEQSAQGLEEVHVSLRENPLTWFARRFSSTKETYSLDLKPRSDVTRLSPVLLGLKKTVDRPPTDARLLISEHTIVPSEEGRDLSVAASLVRLAAAPFESSLVVELVVERVKPKVTEEDLAPVDITRILAAYETSFRGKAGSRAVNIHAAASYLNGAIILPGEVLSFNDQVGQRIHGRGFVDAPVIVNDELEQDVGGGVCQVATTLHAAAVYGNLEVVNRRSHSRPSGYAPLGLDATVIDGKVDLKLRNNFDEPVLVYVSFPSTYVIRVELLGRDPDVHVEHAYTVTHREPFARRVWYREEMPAGGMEQKQKGSEGMDVVSVVRIKSRDGEVTRRTYNSKYYPVPEVFWLGEGASLGGLPALPEGATGVEVDGESRASTSDGARPEQEVPPMEEADSLKRRKPSSANVKHDRES